MNFKLIFLLSLFGLAMAFATISLIPLMIEPVFWLIILLVCAYLIAKYCKGKYFLHGFLVSLLNCVWITSAHILFFMTYLKNHPQEANMWSNTSLALHPRLTMAITGPVIGIISGFVLGLFAFIASKIFKKKAPSA